MSKKLYLPLFDVGFELEFFISPSNASHVILNASKEMQKRLGFSIDQNDHFAGSIKLGLGYDFVTDGTACELRWFRPDNYGVLPTNHIKVIEDLAFLKGLSHLFFPCFQAGQKQHGYGPLITFDSPGRVFASQKMLTNAYSGETVWSEKKDDAEVTLRTAGLHLHFSVSAVATKSAKTHKDNGVDLNQLIFWPFADQHVNSPANKQHTNALVKILDQIYETELTNHHGFYVSAASKIRAEQYQTMGDYRIRAEDKTETKKPTLEYRQFDSGTSLAQVQKIIDIFQYEAKGYLESVINA